MQINGSSPTYRGTGPLAPGATVPTGEAQGSVPAAAPEAVTPAERGTRNLTTALVAAFGSMSPPVQALFDVLTGGLTQKSYQALVAKNVTVEMLQKAAVAFAPMLLGFQPVGQIQGAGALSWLSQAKGLEDLLRTPENEAKAGQALIDQLVGAILPGPENALLRQGGSELLSRGVLEPATAVLLGQEGLRTLGDVLGRYRDLLLAVAPAETAPPLNSMLYAVGLAASAPSPTGASITAAAQNALPAGMQQAGPSATFGGSASTSGSVGASLPGGGGYAAAADASASYGGGAYAEGSAGIDDTGAHAEGRIGVDFHAEAEANAHGELDTGISKTTLDAHVDAAIDARAEASGSVRLDGDGLHAEGHVGAEVHAEANASVDMDTSLFGGAVGETAHLEGHAEAEASAEASGRLNAGFDDEGNFELDLGFDAHASATAEADVRGAASINVFGFTFGVEGYAEAQAGVEAGVSGWLSYKDGQLHVGGSLGAALGIGGEVGGGLVIGIPPFLQDAVSGAAHMGGGAIDGLGDAAKAVGDFFGGLFGASGGSPAATEPALPTAPAWSLGDLGDWMDDLAGGGTSAGEAIV